MTFFFKRWLSTPHTVHFQNQSDSASKLLPSNKWHTFKKKQQKSFNNPSVRDRCRWNPSFDLESILFASETSEIQPAEKYPVERYPRYPNSSIQCIQYIHSGNCRGHVVIVRESPSKCSLVLPDFMQSVYPLHTPKKHKKKHTHTQIHLLDTEECWCGKCCPGTRSRLWGDLVQNHGELFTQIQPT